MPHRQLTKTYKRLFLANPTECSPEELGSASELLWLTFSRTCSEQSFTRSSPPDNERFVPYLPKVWELDSEGPEVWGCLVGVPGVHPLVEAHGRYGRDPNG